MDSSNEDQASGAALPMPPAPTADTHDQVPADPAYQAVFTPTVAAQDEDDVIDRAWIAKVKEIIANTSGDPYKQSQQLAALKVEYLHKRYNKTINTGN